MIPNITWGADFLGIVRYLIENRDHEVLGLQGVSSIDLAAEEMDAIASLNDRATNTLMHLSLSAAHEDGLLDKGQWLFAADRLESTLGLEGNARVIVRHRDKTHDHVHGFWCTISPETGRTPLKKWFLKKGCAALGIGPHALTDEEVARIPAENRARRTYDFRALARAQHTCRQLERELGLRQLRTPEQAAKARLAGEERTPSPAQKKRAERVGSTPLIERAAEIRDALDTADWPSKREALCAIGLDFEPVFRTTGKGTELRGLVIFEAADPGNRMKASELDLPHRKFGWRRLEERHEPGAAGLEAWWSERALVVPGRASDALDPSLRLKRAFDLLTEQHRFAEREKRGRLRELRQVQSLARRRKRRELMQQRRDEASRLASVDRAAFYKAFATLVRAPVLAALAAEHKNDAAKHRRARKPEWAEFLAMCADRGDLEAVAMLQAHARPACEARVIERAVSSIAPSVTAPTIDTTPAAETPQPAQPVLIEGLSPADLLAVYQNYRCRGR